LWSGPVQRIRLTEPDEVIERREMDRVIIFDTTLRDGEQSPGATLNVE